MNHKIESNHSVEVFMELVDAIYSHIDFFGQTHLFKIFKVERCKVRFKYIFSKLQG